MLGKGRRFKLPISVVASYGFKEPCINEVLFGFQLSIVLIFAAFANFLSFVSMHESQMSPMVSPIPSISGDQLHNF